MPKTLFQNVIFTLMMSFLMVYVMICYNICLNVGGMSNEVFLMAFGELKIMWPVAFVLEFVFVDKLAHMLAFRIVTGQTNLHHSCNLFHDRMYHVPLHESCCNNPVQEGRKQCNRHLVSDNIHELPGCVLLADLLLRTIHPSDLQKDVS